MIDQRASPGQADQLLQQAVRYHEAGQIDAAEALYLRVLAQRRADFGALHMLGVCRHQRGDYEGALKHLRAAVKMKPNGAQGHVNLGNTLRELKRLPEAIQSYRRATLIDPRLDIALYNLGTALEEQGTYAEAIAVYERLCAGRANAPAQAGRGNCLVALGRTEEAIAAYRDAIALDPAQAGAHANLGAMLLQRQEFAAALDSVERAIALQPHHAEANLNKGIILNELGRPEEALAAFDRARDGATETAEMVFQRALAVGNVGQTREARILLESVLELSPGHWAARGEHATVLAVLGDPVTAARLLDAMLAERPDDANIRGKRAIAAYFLGDLDRARTDIEDLLAVNPALPLGRFNLGQIYLLQGRFREGFTLYEGRWEVPAQKKQRRDFPQAMWLGKEDLSSRTLLVHSEQGIGDTVQFSRYVHEIARRAQRVVFEVRGPILALLARSMPAQVTCIPFGAPLPPFDLHCPLLSLPLACDTTLETIPAAVPYLFADPARVALWRGRLRDKPPLRIGLAWSGNPSHVQDHARSIPLAALQGLLHHADHLRAGGVEFIALQNALRPGDREVLAALPSLQYFGDALESFDDTAALITLCDLVISVDSAPAHVAGGLGAPVWVLLQYVPDWRWMLERSDSPWYPSARLFRQPELGQWDAVIERVGTELEAVLATPPLFRSQAAAAQAAREDS
jgi:tetratricopeptide (TPR) repeat protein